MKKKISIIFLTYNSENSIQRSIEAAKKITNQIIIVDSFSTDKTIKICNKFNCIIFKRKFINYSDQRNWIIKKLNLKYKWQLHLDADEILDKNLILSINDIIENEKKIRCFLIKKKYYFLNQKLSYPGLNPWHLRLFKSKTSTCEIREYDQHFITKFKTKNIINGHIKDIDKINLSRWKIKHLKWAKMEANEVFNKKNLLNIFNNQDKRFKNRNYKNIYYRFPILIRPILYFIYRYIFKKAFLDGYLGFRFTFYQAFWFRTVVDIEILKLRVKSIKKF